MDYQLPSELQRAFESAVTKYNRWRSGEEPTVTYQKKERSLSSICTLLTFYENVPLRPAIMALRIAVADERHADLKNDLENNYASALTPVSVAVTSPSRGDESLAGRNFAALCFISLASSTKRVTSDG